MSAFVCGGWKTQVPDGVIAPLPCVKCGSESGWTGPVYRGVETLGFRDIPPMFSQWLEFTCVVCGYKRSERTKDAKEAVTWIIEEPRPWWSRWWGQLQALLAVQR
jgi:Zn ribbon nucleic-acid-binding protein